MPLLVRTLRYLRRGGPAVLALLLSGAVSASALEYEVWTPPQVGEELPDFALKDASGREVRLSDYRGKVILLTFWSCFADSCFTSIPRLEQLGSELGPAGLVLPSVCVEVPPALAANNYKGLIERCGRGQTLLIDEQKTMKKRFRVLHCPTAFLVGRDFKIRKIIVDMAWVRDPRFAEEVAALVNEPSPDR